MIYKNNIIINNFYVFMTLNDKYILKNESKDKYLKL